jgi:hypothetical protein
MVLNRGIGWSIIIQYQANRGIRRIWGKCTYTDTRPQQFRAGRVIPWARTHTHATSSSTSPLCSSPLSPNLSRLHPTRTGSGLIKRRCSTQSWSDVALRPLSICPSNPTASSIPRSNLSRRSSGNTPHRAGVSMARWPRSFFPKIRLIFLIICLLYAVSFPSLAHTSPPFSAGTATQHFFFCEIL